MERRESLRNIFKDIDENQKTLINNLLDDVVFMEEQMAALKKLPFINVNKNDVTKQKKTEAAKLYKEFSQSYMNAIRILILLFRNDESETESPLRAYLKQLNDKD